MRSLSTDEKYFFLTSVACVSQRLLLYGKDDDPRTRVGSSRMMPVLGSLWSKLTRRLGCVPALV
jgi:hypothetical protein